MNHSRGQYVGDDGETHVNGVESVWALLKRGIYGTWHSVSKKHLRRYVDETTFRLNEGRQSVPVIERLYALTTRTFGCRLTWKDLAAG